MGGAFASSAFGPEPIFRGGQGVRRTISRADIHGAGTIGIGNNAARVAAWRTTMR